MNKYVITSIVFIIIVGIISSKTFFDNRNEFINALKSNDKIRQINELFNVNTAFSDVFLDLWSATQKIAGTELLDDAEYGYIIKDYTGNLYFPANDVDVSTYAQNLIRFANKVKSKDISFTYIQAPNKVIKGYSSDMVYEYNFSNKNAYEFIKILKDNGVSVLDLREKIFTSGIPVDRLFYKTDHHWTTPTAFWANQEIIKYLNENYNLELDEKYTNISNYNTREIKDCYVGSLGRRVGVAVSGLDSYTFIEPNFETNYEIINGIDSSMVGKGSFHNAIVKDKILNSKDPEANKHATYFEWDYGNLIIKNKLINNDKKILLIKDSYALPVAAFLSTCVNEIHMVDLRDVPTVNLEEYIDENNFDAVIMMYNTEVFNEKMFNFSM